MNNNKNIERNDQLDSFSSHFREQLQDYSVEVDESLWNDLEKRMAHGERKVKRISPAWWLSGVACAAVVLLAFLFLKLDEGKRAMHVANISSPTNTPKPSHPKEWAEPSKKAKLYSACNTPKRAHNSPRVIQVEASDSTLDIETEQQAAILPIEKTNDRPDATAQRKEESPIQFLDPRNKAIEDRLLEQIEDTKTKSGTWTLALHTGTGASANRFTNRIPDVSGGIPMNGGFSSEKKSFMPPLSFGLALRRNYSNKLGIETGVSYTYLRTKISPSSSSPSTLDLHYLGFSLGMSYSLWKSEQWEIYWSAGGMVEKGISASYTTNSGAKHESIRGLQWSVQTSPGISYMLKKPIGLYLQPKLSYYFDNDQPLSIRTEHPFGVGIEVGLRYDF